jgi:excisionase family DNA binding protein
MTTRQQHLVRLKDAVDMRPWLTLRWLRRAVFERRVPYYKVGALVLIDLNELDAYVEAARVDAI